MDELISAANHANLKRVTIGLRPECFSIEGRGGAGLKLEVSLVEELGADAYLYGRLAGDEAEERLLPYALSAISVGETVTLAVRFDSPHVFRPETGDRIL
jgi:multiple sugar transport system ATP-binding protein